MNNAIRLLPIALAATLTLSACGSHDDGAGNTTTGALSNEEVVPAGELGDLNATAAEGNFGDANLQDPANAALANDTAADATGNGA